VQGTREVDKTTEQYSQRQIILKRSTAYHGEINNIVTVCLRIFYSRHMTDIVSFRNKNINVKLFNTFIISYHA